MVSTRRDFLKGCAGILGLLVAEPLRLFVPPREPYVRQAPGLDGLYSHLGILPWTEELNICEGCVLDIDRWDGTGYPVLIENRCTFGGNPPRVWVYDFDLWNFRHDDAFGPIWKRPDYAGLPNHNAWHATRRFGSDFERMCRTGGGMLGRQMFGCRQLACRKAR
jgi:hypothetical protein